MRQWQLKKEKHWNSSWISGLKETQSLWEHLYCSHFCSLHQTSVGFRLFKETCVWHGWDKSAINPRSIGWAAHPGHQGTAAPSPGRAEQAAVLLVIHSISLYIGTFTAPEHVACVVLSGICCFSSWSLFLHINHVGGSQREWGTPAVVLNYSCT